LTINVEEITQLKTPALEQIYHYFSLFGKIKKIKQLLFLQNEFLIEFEKISEAKACLLLLDEPKSEPE